MRAYIEPLEGKYYGTRIRFTHPHGESAIEVWFMGDFKPSERELAKLNPEDDPRDIFCDSHYETQDGYEIAKTICEALNKI